jgi:hypothetical protein
MAKQTLAVGSNANDGTGDTLRAAMIKVNEMFTEVYNSPGIAADTISISGNDISAVRSNDDLIFTPAGTGTVRTNSLSFNGNNIEGVRSNDDINLVPSGTGSVLLAGIRINDNNIEGVRSNDDINFIPAGTGAVTTPALRFNGNNIEGVRSNENINLTPSGTGSVVFGAIKISGTSLSSDDSTAININEGLIVDGTANVSGNVTLTGAVTAESTLEVTGNTTLANLTVTGTSTLTGTSTVDNLTFNDNIIGTSSNADLRLVPGGTGTVVISNLTVDDNINITDNIIKTTVSNSPLQLSGSGSGTVEVTSGLTTAAITTVGNVSITGTETITGQLDVDYVRIKDNTITTNASNANLEISANGSGNVVIDDVDIGGGAIDGTVIGAASAAAGTFTTVTATTSVTIDGVTITDNTVSTNASNSPLELTGNGTGSVTISGFTFPTSDGSAGQFLKTDGLGTLSWGSAGATLSYSDIADATTTVATSTTSVMNTFAHGTYRSAKYFISIVDATNSRYEIVEANVTHDGSDAYIATFGSTTNYTGGLCTFSADISGSNVRVLVTNISDASTVFKFQVTYIDA